LAEIEIRLNLLAIFRAYAPLTITASYFPGPRQGRRKHWRKKENGGAEAPPPDIACDVVRD
jgi:hypothetical protein